MGDNDMKRLFNEIADLRKDQTDTRKLLEAKIDDICKELSGEINRAIDDKIHKLRNEIENEFGKYSKRMSDIEERLHHISTEGRQLENPLKDTELCIVASYLPYENDEDLPVKVDCLHVLRDIGLVNGNDVVVIATERLPKRFPNQTPLVKVAFRSVEQKIKVLRYRSKLVLSKEFKLTRIWGSKTHAERLIEGNFHTILNAIPGLKSSYRVTNHGKVVPILNPNGQEDPPDSINRKGSRNRTLVTNLYRPPTSTKNVELSLENSGNTQTTSVPDRSYRRTSHGTQFNNNDYHRNFIRLAKSCSQLVLRRI